MPDRGVERSRLSLYGSASLKGVPEGLVEAAEPKPIAGGFCPGGHGAATMQQQLGLLAEHQSKQRRWRRNDRQAVHHSADFFGNLALPPDVRGNRVHRSAVLETLEGQAI